MSTRRSQPRLERWRSALSNIDECPWRGPRPFTADDPREQLVGREQDCDRFRHVVEQHRLIFLTGPSGVGKTSLLEAGLVRDLEETGSTVLVCREWGGKGATASAVSFLAEKVHAALELKGMKQRPDPSLGEYSSDSQLFWELRDDFGARAVLVLDQFEELIRYTPSLREELYEVLAEINARLPIKVVISFRDEYLLQLRRLQRLAQPFSLAEYVLEEVVDLDDVWKLITSANRRDKPEVITADAGTRIVARWKTARSPEDPGVAADPLLRIGLLHLQALLYSLWDRTGGATVTKEDVEAFAGDLTGAALFLTALDESIDVKLERCRVAGAYAGLDPFLVEGTTHVVARLVRHLSSAGYKLVRGANDLAQVTMGTEFEILRRDVRCDSWSFMALQDGMIESISRSRDPLSEEVRLLDDDRQTIAEDADRRRRSLTNAKPLDEDWATMVARGPSPTLADPTNLTSGPMRGLAPAAVLVEELRRFVFALIWLDETSLVRLSSPGSGGLMVSLIHDGFGESLLRWSDARLLGPQGAIHSITGPQGEVFEWKDARPLRPGEESLLCNETPRVIANLRWRSAGIHADLRRVVFVNCDFRSAFWRDCRLDGVTFVNCQLENMVFMDCEISRNEPADRDRLRDAQEHARLDGPPPAPMTSGRDVMGLDQSMLRVEAEYRGIEGDDFALLAQAPDLPAIPVPMRDGEAVRDWAHLGGMAVYGSRVSSMVIRRCRGDVTLHRCTGAGFAIDDYVTGNIAIHGSTLRQVRITPGENREDIHVLSVDSALAQVWLGEGLLGTFVSRGGTLLQVWNESAALDASAEGSAVYGTIGVKLRSCRPLPGLSKHNGRTTLIRSEDVFDAYLPRSDEPRW